MGHYLDSLFLSEHLDTAEGDPDYPPQADHTGDRVVDVERESDSLPT